MKLNVSLVLFLTVGLIGCATQPQPQSTWFKSGATQFDFENDRAACNAQAFSVGSGNLMQIAIVQNQCMQGKGWRLQRVN
jgi:hypothetical protein